MEWEFTTCISGRYKHFKREVDLVREEFEDNNVLVLQPPIGSLERLREDGFTPIKEELHLPIKVVEDTFLAGIKRSDFLYIVNPDGTVGTSIWMEIGYAAGCYIPVFVSNSLDDINDEEHERKIKSAIMVATVPEVIETMRNYRQEMEEARLHPQPQILKIWSRWDGPILPFDPNKPPIFTRNPFGLS